RQAFGPSSITFTVEKYLRNRDRALADDRVREGAVGRVVGLRSVRRSPRPWEPDAAHGAHARALDGAALEHLAAPLGDTTEVAAHLPHPDRWRGHGLARVHEEMLGCGVPAGAIAARICSDSVYGVKRRAFAAVRRSLHRHESGDAVANRLR